MTHPGSGNSTWQDWPSQATLITAERLEAIELALDGMAGTRPSDGGVAVYMPSGSPNQSVPANSTPRLALGVAMRNTTLVTRTAVGEGATATINRTGLWAVSLGVGMNNTASGVKRAHIFQSGTDDANSVMCPTNLTTNETQGVGVFGGNSWTGRLTQGTVLNPYVYSRLADSVAAANTSLALAYLGPA